jgi:uncharacterized protein YggE
MKIAALIFLLSAASPVAAQTPTPSQILVSASGTAKNAPDMATVSFTLRGEGATSDEAAEKLRDSADAVKRGVRSLLRGEPDFQASRLAIGQVRPKECDANNYGQQRLSTGPCAIIGYIATLPVAIDTPRIQDAGTLVTLIGRLGGLDATLQRYWLKDEAAARRAATQAALINARAQATLIAEGSGNKLGALLRIQDSEYREINLGIPERTPMLSVNAPPPPPPPPAPPPPIRIDLAPEPIQTTVRLMAAYGIDR